MQNSSKLEPNSREHQTPVQFRVGGNKNEKTKYKQRIVTKKHKTIQLPTTRENRNQENRINQPVHEKDERWIMSSSPSSSYFNLPHRYHHPPHHHHPKIPMQLFLNLHPSLNAPPTPTTTGTTDRQTPTLNLSSLLQQGLIHASSSPAHNLFAPKVERSTDREAKSGRRLMIS